VHQVAAGFKPHAISLTINGKSPCSNIFQSDDFAMIKMHNFITISVN